MNTRTATVGRPRGSAAVRNPLRAVAAFGAIRKRRLVLPIAIGAGAVIAATALLGTSGYLISKAALRPPILTLMVAIVGVRFFGVARALLRYAERIDSHEIALNSLARMRSRFFARLVPLIPGSPGLASPDLLSRFVSDVESLRDLYVRIIIPPLAGIVASLVAVAAAAVVLPAAGVVLAAGLLAAGTLAPWLTARIARRSGERQAPARAHLTAELVDTLRGGGELAVMGAGRAAAERVAAADAELTDAYHRDALAAAASAGMAMLISGLTAVAVLVVASKSVAEGGLSGVMLAVPLLIAIVAFEGVAPLASAAQCWQTCHTAACRVLEIIEGDPVTEAAAAPGAVPSGGALSAENVRFRYAPGQPWLLDGASLELQPGARVALVGPSGTGKSTLAHLFVRFLDPVAGRVTLGGVDLRELDGDAERDVVRLEGQNGFLFSASIRDNVKLARPNAADHEIASALTRAGLGPWLESLPEGIDTSVGESGMLVSGGQRQRIAFARALLARARFMILDEPTAHLDSDGAQMMIDAILEQTPADSGVLVITHDPAVAAKFDRVHRLAGGVLQ